MKPFAALALTAIATSIALAGPGPFQPAKPAPNPAPIRLVPVGTPIVLDGPYATARLLIDRVAPGATAADATGDSLFSSADPRVATVDDQGNVRARGVGVTEIVVATVGGTTAIPVTVRAGKPPAFLDDVVPVLAKAGCSTGACHGANAGRGGFHLSLLGYEPDTDWLAITRHAAGRRISRSDPEESLLLNKAVGGANHGGGTRFTADSAEYRTLRDWIAAGAPGPATPDPIQRLDVFPGARTLVVGQTQRYRVVATTQSGRTRDVTAQTLFSSADGGLLKVERDGTATAVAPGEGAVVVRYGGAFTVARTTTPFGIPRTPAPSSNPIDRLVNQKAAALGLEPSPLCTDDEFLRRATLDITGRLPTPDQVRTFLAERAPDKRAKLVDSLIGNSDYVDHWTLKWADLLRVAKKTLFPKGVDAYYGWIKDAVAKNRPWDQVSRELLTSTGSAFQNGPVNFLRAGTEMYQPTADPRDLGEATAQTLFGVRLQCARCHNHPYEKWTQDQFLQLSAFFARVESKPGAEPQEQVVGTNTWGEIWHPRGTGRVLPAALDAKPLPADYSADRRVALADWMTAAENPFFAKLLANRLWKHFLGRGLVEPVDDFRVTNPSTNDPLLEHLATDLRTHGFDLRRSMRQIVLSETYQRASRSTPGNARDTRYHTRFIPRRLGAEPLLDAVGDATGTSETFDGYPAGTRAAQLKETSVASAFLDAFGRPARHTTCECERSFEPSVGQALLLLNSPIVQNKLGAAGGRVRKLVERKASHAQIVEELTLATLGRFPTPDVIRKGTEWLAAAKDPVVGAEDLLWALLNAKEFVFNR